MAESPEPGLRPLPDWAEVPPGYLFRDVSDVAVNSKNQVYLLTRDPAVLVYDSEGRFLTSWGADVLSARPHGITIGPDDSVYVADEGDQLIRKFTTTGVQTLTLGTKGVMSDTGCDWDELDFTKRVRSIKHSSGPFNHPTKLAVAPDGDLFVADGYGNARIHHFRADGEFVSSWGEPGTGPGEFHVPHSLCFDRRGRLLVADRENNRIQLFDMSGSFLEEWPSQRPTAIAVDSAGRVVVAELRWDIGGYSWIDDCVITSRIPSRLRILDERGNVQQRYGGGPDPLVPGDFLSPHGIAVDADGDVYVVELAYAALGQSGSTTRMRPTHCVQKLTRGIDPIVWEDHGSN
jgi:DNA-binding beta-propeller fold protein YncE